MTVADPGSRTPPKRVALLRGINLGANRQVGTLRAWRSVSPSDCLLRPAGHRYDPRPIGRTGRRYRKGARSRACHRDGPKSQHDDKADRFAHTTL